jgi:hypothetical protein
VEAWPHTLILTSKHVCIHKNVHVYIHVHMYSGVRVEAWPHTLLLPSKHVCMHKHVHVYIYTYTYILRSEGGSLAAHLASNKQTKREAREARWKVRNVCACVCMCTYVYIYMCVCVCVCVCVYMYAYMYTVRWDKMSYTGTQNKTRVRLQVPKPPAGRLYRHTCIHIVAHIHTCKHTHVQARTERQRAEWSARELSHWIDTDPPQTNLPAKDYLGEKSTRNQAHNYRENGQSRSLSLGLRGEEKERGALSDGYVLKDRHQGAHMYHVKPGANQAYSRQKSQDFPRDNEDVHGGGPKYNDTTLRLTAKATSRQISQDFPRDDHEDDDDVSRDRLKVEEWLAKSQPATATAAVSGHANTDTLGQYVGRQHDDHRAGVQESRDRNMMQGYVGEGRKYSHDHDHVHSGSNNNKRYYHDHVHSRNVPVGRFGHVQDLPGGVRKGGKPFRENKLTDSD